MVNISKNNLFRLAQKYVWWKDPSEAIQDTNYLLACIMTMGTLEDIIWTEDHFNQKRLQDVLRYPPIGVFNGRSWYFWHYRLNLAEEEADVPEMPSRKFDQ